MNSRHDHEALLHVVGSRFGLGQPRCLAVLRLKLSP
jgi:hypothetical protein